MRGSLRRYARTAFRFEQAVQLRFVCFSGFRAFTLGQVPGEFGESAESSALIAQGRDSNVRPKLCSVFANAPSFINKSASFGGHLTFVLRPSALYHIRRIEL
jgi:hypothetical protein